MIPLSSAFLFGGSAAAGRLGLSSQRTRSERLIRQLQTRDEIRGCLQSSGRQGRGPATGPLWSVEFTVFGLQGHGEQPVCFLFSDSVETKVSAALMLRDSYAIHDIFIRYYGPSPVVCLVSARWGLREGRPRRRRGCVVGGGVEEAEEDSSAPPGPRLSSPRRPALSPLVSRGVSGSRSTPGEALGVCERGCQGSSGRSSRPMSSSGLLAGPLPAPEQAGRRLSGGLGSHRGVTGGPGPRSPSSY